MSAPGESGGTYGYLALLQLCASSVVDGRLTNSQRGVLILLAKYAGADGTCCVSLMRLADQLFVTRQTVQKAARSLEHAGYFTSQRRNRTNGGEGAKVFAFNLDLKGAVACPLPQPKGVHTPEAAGGCTLQRLHIRYHSKKPS